MFSSDKLQRRHFIATGSALIASAKTSLSAPLKAAEKDPYGGWPVGVQSYSLRQFNTLEAIRHIQGMGLHFAEFYSKHLSVQATAEQIAETSKLCASAKIKLNAHGVNRFTKDHAANRKIFAFAKRAGIKNITADPDPDSFDSLDKLVAEFGIRVCIHNHGPKHRYNTIADVQNAVSKHHKWIGACVDTGHFIRGGTDPVKAVRDLGPRVFAVHIKDDKFKGDPRSHNVVIGQANLDVVGLFKALKTIDFPRDGSLSLEYESNPQNPIDDMKQCLEVARAAIAKAAKA